MADQAEDHHGRELREATYSGHIMDPQLLDVYIYYQMEAAFSVLGLLLLLVSVYKTHFRRYRTVTSATFWVFGLLGYASMLVYGLLYSIPRENYKVFLDVPRFLHAVGISCTEVSLGVVNLAALEISCLVRAVPSTNRRPFEAAWLVYTLYSHVPFAILIAWLQLRLVPPEDLIYWHFMWMAPTQIINLIAFSLHLALIRRKLSKDPPRQRTLLMLNIVLGRFVDFLTLYALYALSGILPMIVSSMDAAGAFPVHNWSGIRMIQAGLVANAGFRFCTFMGAVYTFRPHWAEVLMRGPQTHLFRGDMVLSEPQQQTHEHTREHTHIRMGGNGSAVTAEAANDAAAPPG